MSETISIMFDENGMAKLYDDTFDISIHCESEEEQNKVLEILNRQWIPVSKEFPMKGKQVLCCNRKGSVFTSAVTYVAPNYVNFGSHCDVIAWMPLPEPYKEE